jgi:fluoroacetyl-CoA thioesterase
MAMPTDSLRVGLRQRTQILVDDGLTVPRVSRSLPVFADMPAVFATAFLVAFVEATCIEMVAPFLPAGHKTVGTHVDLSHLAATPAGMTVVAEVELVAITGRALRFSVECRDEQDVISRGYHERHIIDSARFDQRVSSKAYRGAP